MPRTANERASPGRLRPSGRFFLPRICGSNARFFALPLLSVLLFGGCGSQKGTPSSTGTWVGSLGPPGGNGIGAQFDLTEANGQLTGLAYFQDPESGELLSDDEVQGSRSGSMATWQTTSTGVVVAGTFDGSSFSGTIQFPPDPVDGTVFVTALSLHH